ncbi:MAG: D-glycero-beta-D-manno-heptose 1-phosphate adenylyltransferase [Acidobacteria bacterium]|nr:MAG: D-glycero-beta-D-manno-heptose 1-phosphate adenylyltransferase [Acidobacteriota bacterium]RPJ77349.1 MAG: D-glycero-beta-D-manno-heptose 1-phosphate adenylyltransferase [Acidobacteriota bacterium]
MSDGPSELIKTFGALTVLVVGDAILDSYLDGESQRLCREAPVPIVALTGRRDAAGGAANVAANLRRLGARVRLLSVAGEDSEGTRLRGVLEREGIDTAWLLVSRARTTLAKTRVLASGQMLVRFDQGSGAPLDPTTEDILVAALTRHYRECDAVVVSDYAYGVLTPRVIEVLAGLQAAAPRVLTVDSRDLLSYRGIGVTAVKPNHEEATRLLGPRPIGARGDRAEAIMRHGDRLLDLTGSQIAAVTLDVDGALVLERGRAPYRTYARPARNVRAPGAGDTFVAVFTLALAAGGHTPAASELASAAAAIVVGKDGTSVCEARELIEHFDAAGKCLDDLGRLAAVVSYHRQQGRRVIFTNGCFDILHRGHITYLNKAKALGDLLVVGINSDGSVRRLKGDGRPINTLEDRVQVLAALSCIDHIVPFDTDTPADLIEAIRPDVFVKGGDYTRNSLPEAALVERLGGAVQLLPLVEDRSTSGIIERVRASSPASPGDAATGVRR